MPKLLLVMLGGAIGAGLRYGVGTAAAARLGTGWPWGTFIVNLAGGLLMGLLAAFALERGRASEPLLLLLGVGVLGGFTTFSAFSLEAAQMIERGEIGLAGAYSFSSVFGAVLMLFAGLWIGRASA